MKITYILLGILALIAIGGAVYVMRPVSVPPVTLQPSSTVLPTNITTPMPTPSAQSSITPLQKTVQATLKTSLGTIELELNGQVAPLAVGNFVQLAKSGFYNGVTFHRVIKGFMIQGGDPTGTGSGGPGYTFKTELNDQKFVKGALGVARTNQLDTNGSQFFIMTADNFSLNGQYTQFGKVLSGQDVVDTIANVQTDQNDKPVQPVTIESVTIH